MITSGVLPPFGYKQSSWNNRQEEQKGVVVSAPVHHKDEGLCSKLQVTYFYLLLCMEQVGKFHCFHENHKHGGRTTEAAAGIKYFF